MIRKQQTLQNPFTLSGKGLHTGKEVTITVKPGAVDTGYIFKRIDLENQPEIAALAEFVVDTSRGTVIGKGGVTISTIEHLIASLYALGIDNAIIEIDAPEVPILDGSAKPFVAKIIEAGIALQQKDLFVLKLKEKITHIDEVSGSEISIIPDDSYSIDALISFPGSHILANQFASLKSLDNFCEEIAPCKTFVFLHELEYLLNNNLIKGGDLENALVIVDKVVESDELNRIADLFNHPRVEVAQQGILNNTSLIFSNEPSRHKILDIIGDLALSGGRFDGKIIATKPGHGLNNGLARKLRKFFKNIEAVAPVVNFDKEPLMDINQIRLVIPHRPPFLLVDKVMSIEGDTIIAVKNVSMNEPHFVGHFPEEPVMPGVLIVEAMAQTGGLLVLSSVEEPEKYSTYFLKIDNVKFRKKVVPGDTIVFKTSLTTPIRRGVAELRALAFVGDVVVTEATLMAQIVKNK